MGSGQAGKGIGNESSSGHQHAGTTKGPLRQDEMGNQSQGYNRLQGNDQRKVHNQRQTMPEESTRTEGVVESFERMDPKRRAGSER